MRDKGNDDDWQYDPKNIFSLHSLLAFFDKNLARNIQPEHSGLAPNFNSQVRVISGLGFHFNPGAGDQTEFIQMTQ